MDAYFQEIEFHLVNELKGATERVLVAVAWFTNERIAQELTKLRSKYVDIEVVVDDNEINRKSPALRMLSDAQVSVSFVKNLATERALMHDKFAVIDNVRVITGSYNWTINANTNNENIFVFEDRLTATYYIHEFRRIVNINKPNDKVFITEVEHNGIINFLIVEFKKILSECVATHSFQENLCYNYFNLQLINRIRAIKEELTINLKQKVGTFFVYQDLLQKYGWDFRQKATQAEMVKSRDRFRKEGLDEYEDDVETIFKRMKFRALHLIICQYITLLKSKRTESEVERILDVYEFLLKERNRIGRELGISVVSWGER
jgi:phosphatidylserine/phosphatidylglycerophosphate/cardiolipin synthase-like enzyme